MNIAVVTLFPEMFSALTDYGVSGRALDNKLIQLRCFNPRDHAEDRHKTVDDRPYGGGPGMVMKIEPLERALSAAKQWLVQCSQNDCGVKDESLADANSAPVVYLSPQGKTLNQSSVEGFLEYKNLVLIAGRYEGIDERFILEHVDHECSIGDYVLSGGELPAMVLIDALARLQPGALGASESAQQDSFVNGLLDCPHFTRPETYRGRAVPSVLLSGNHGKIGQWRHMQSLGRTQQRRPDLLQQLELSAAQLELLKQYESGHLTDDELN